ncbi:MAG: DNA primase [Gammaproteobacteria bacterium]|nr:DNA primase [Gammaproteobacteria bacterium]
MSSKIPDSFIQDVLGRTDIVEIIQARLKLTKKGKEYLAVCPFHNEKSPSFSVSPAKQFYYCFGCHAHGNSIGFLMQYDRMDFVEAIGYLANQLGMEIPVEQGSRYQAQDKGLIELLGKINQYYQRQFEKSDAAIDYLKQREINLPDVKAFQIGYVPANWDNLCRHIRDQTQQDQLIKSGMIIRKDDGHCYDRFRNRLMFPIHNQKGEIIGFGGRSLGDDMPKYMNSPETELFHKSRELYGLYQARQSTRQLTQFILVEGYLDVIALHQFGIKNAVATLGTAVSAGHLQKLLHQAKEIIFCFDGDRAGQQAAWKALTLSLPLMRDDVSFKFLFLPAGEDPDSLVHKEGNAAFQERINNAFPLSTVFFTKFKREFPLQSLDAKARFARAASQHLNTMPKGVMRELFYKQLTQILQVEARDLASLIETTITETKPDTNTEPKTSETLQPARPIAQAITLLLHYPKLAKEQLPSGLNELTLPGTHLLCQLLETYRRAPILSIGGLLATYEDPAERTLIAELAARELAVPPEGAMAEFQGALQQCLQQTRKQKINQLIAKAKYQELGAPEKRILQDLLAAKVGETLD